jgi:iron complex transport system permease protein
MNLSPSLAEPASLRRPARTRSASFGRVGFLVIALLAASVVLLVLSLMLGVTPIPPDQVVRILLTGEGERVPQLVITTLRLPRALLGMSIGAAMALTGVIMQDSLRNALADPGLLGVSTGASLAVAMVVVFEIALPAGSMPAIAWIGGLVSGMIILLTTRLTRDPVRTILIGAALTALMGALITTTILLAEPDDLKALYSFLVGSLIGSSNDQLMTVLPWLVVGIPVSLLFGRTLNLLQLGDDMAAGLGLPVFRTRFVLFVLSIGMTATVVAVAGPIGFVALIAPHMTRYLLRTTDSRQVLPVSALMGAVLLLASDLIAREIFKPAELPVGLILTLVGSPIALLLLRRAMHERRH